jgi:hypothetical protein
MKTVFQENETDCGIACVAMLCGITLFRAKGLCKHIYVDGYGIDSAPMAALLHQQGFEIGTKGRVGPKNPLWGFKSDAILQCKLLPSRGAITEENSVGHWVVWDNDQKVVRDPSAFQKPIWITSFIALLKRT